MNIYEVPRELVLSKENLVLTEEIEGFIQIEKRLRSEALKVRTSQPLSASYRLPA